jgi:hypothetical protein
MQSLGDPLSGSSNTQVPEKFQLPSSRLGQLVDDGSFGFLWMLELGFWNLSFFA